MVERSCHWSCAKSTTHGDPIAMAFCTLRIQPLITSLHETADDAGGTDSTTEMKRSWDTLSTLGPWCVFKYSQLVFRKGEHHFFCSARNSGRYDVIHSSLSTRLSLYIWSRGCDHRFWKRVASFNSTIKRQSIQNKVNVIYVRIIIKRRSQVVYPLITCLHLHYTCL